MAGSFGASTHAHGTFRHWSAFASAAARHASTAPARPSRDGAETRTDATSWGALPTTLTSRPRASTVAAHRPSRTPLSEPTNARRFAAELSVRAPSSAKPTATSRNGWTSSSGSNARPSGARFSAEAAAALASRVPSAVLTRSSWSAAASVSCAASRNSGMFARRWFSTWTRAASTASACRSSRSFAAWTARSTRFFVAASRSRAGSSSDVQPRTSSAYRASSFTRLSVTRRLCAAFFPAASDAAAFSSTFRRMRSCQPQTYSARMWGWRKASADAMRSLALATSRCIWYCSLVEW
mmetsp:Transcript_9675/g.33299  ORF Transcript_9675/g.33299 Transcript_9675/m.33299 type:complete len:296 (-) Transcript_9675:125-1012(-)